MLSILLIGIVLTLAYRFAIKPFRYWKEKGVPYIKPIPIVGNLGNAILGKFAFPDLLQHLYCAKPDKRYVGFYQFQNPTLLIRDPHLLKRILIKEFDTFPRHLQFVPDGVDRLWNRCLIGISNREKWHDMRCVLSPSFTGSKLKMIFNLMEMSTKQFFKHLEKRNDDLCIEVKDVFSKITIDAIASVAFGVEVNSFENHSNAFYSMGKDAVNFGFKFFLYSLNPALMKLLNVKVFSNKVSKFFRGLIKETLRVREEKGIVRNDVLNLLIEARKGRNNIADVAKKLESQILQRPKPEITEEDITAQALVFLIGGFETVSTLMCFASYELAMNEDVQEKLQTEVDEFLLNNGGKITYEMIGKMKYLDMVITETLRKWPPLALTDRVCEKPFTIEAEDKQEQTVTFDEGTNLWVPIYAIQRDPEHFPEPEKFDPERFSDENKHNIKPFTFLPFGVGPRSCIGSRFAMLEAKLVIALLVSRFDIVPNERTQIPVKIQKGTFSMFPENGLWLKFSPRNNNSATLD